MARNTAAVAKALIRAAQNPTNPIAQAGFGSSVVPLQSQGPSPLVASYGDWTGGRLYGTALPRDPAAFLAGAFGPLEPMRPIAIDQPEPGEDRPTPRRWQYPVSWNIPHGTPGDEGLNLACYSEDTEILTRRGWLPFGKLADSDEVATRSEGGQFGWEHPTARHEFDYSGDLIRFCSRAIDLLVTPNHRILHTSGNASTAERVARADKCETLRHGRMIATSTWDAPDMLWWQPSAPTRGYIRIDPIRLRDARELAGLSRAALARVVGTTARAFLRFERGTGRCHVASLPRLEAACRALSVSVGEIVIERDFVGKISGDDFAAFMGAYLSEGCVSVDKRGYSRIYVSQMSYSKGFGPFRDLLVRILGEEPSYDGRSWVFNHDGLASYLSNCGHSAPEKRIPDEVLRLSARQLRIFWDFYLLGDGYRYPSGEAIVTSSPVLAGQLQEVAQKVGLSASVYRRKNVRGGTIRGRAVRSAHGAYDIFLRATKRPRWTSTERIPYVGKVYCVSVPHGIIYVRRNGKAIWSGNSFNTLRTIGDTYSVARACIQLRKSELVGLGWDVVPTTSAEKAMRGDTAARKEFDQRRAKMMKFWRRPDSDYFAFRDWFSVLLEDVLVIDALSLYPWPSTRPGKGVLGSNLGELAAIDGSTIRPLVDVHGGRPKPPNVSHQQYLYGVPRVDMMSILGGIDVDDMTDAMEREYKGDQLIYRPLTPRDWTPYGFAPIEQALVPILSGIQRQQFQLDFFSQGTIPGLFVMNGDVNSTPQQNRELQDALNAMAGDPAWKHKIIVLPAGSRTEPQRPAELAGAFDEVIMTQVTMAFSVMPMELGISPKVSSTQSSGAAHQMAKASQSTMERKANRPMLEWFSDIFNHIIQHVCGQHDMQWWWEGLEEDEDEQTKTAIQKDKVSIGLMSIDEARIENGQQPWGLPTTSDPVLLTATGAIPFGSIDPNTGQPVGLESTPPAAPGTPPEEPPVGGTGSVPAKPPTTPKPGGGAPAGGKPATVPPTPRATPAHAGATQGNATATASPAKPPATWKAASETSGARITRYLGASARKGDSGQRYRHGWIPVEGTIEASHNRLGLPDNDYETVLASHRISGTDSEVRLAHLADRSGGEVSTLLTAGSRSQVGGWRPTAAPQVGDRELTVPMGDDERKHLGRALAGALAGRTSRVNGTDLGDLAIAPEPGGHVRLTVIPYGEDEEPDFLAEIPETYEDEEGNVQRLTGAERQQEADELRAQYLRPVPLTAVLDPGQVNELRVHLTPPATAAEKAVAVHAALRELDLIRRRLNKGRTLDGWTPEHVPAEAFAMARAGNVDGARSVVKAIGHRQVRDAALAGPSTAVVDGLRALAVGLGDGTLSTAAFVDRAVVVLRGGIHAGLTLGMGHARTATIGKADPTGSFGGRYGLYAGQVNQAYEQGYGLATLGGADDPDNIVVAWHARPGACDLCDARDSQEFTVGTLPGWPGDGSFGKIVDGEVVGNGLVLCLGGPACRCELEYRTVTPDEAAHIANDAPAPTPQAQAAQQQIAANLAAVREAFASPDPQRATDAAVDRIADQLAAQQRPYLEGLLQDVLTATGQARTGQPVTVGFDARQSRTGTAGHVDSDEDDGGHFWAYVTATVIAAAVAAAIAHQVQSQQRAAPATNAGQPQPVTKGASDPTDPNPVEAEHVMSNLLANYPPKALGWVRGVRWIGPVEVPTDRVDTDDEATWAAHHQPERVKHFAKALKDGDPVRPGVSVQEPGENRIKVIDGHHRYLAAVKAGQRFRTYVGFVDSNGGPWDQTHSFQYHEGADPANKAAKLAKAAVNYRHATGNRRCGNCSMYADHACTLVAGRIDPQDTCDRWEPQSVTKGKDGPVAAGLVVRADDTGRVLMLQRAFDDDDPAAGRWEFPGGRLDGDETAMDAAQREWSEETGIPVPDGKLVGQWTSDDDVYQGFVWAVPHEDEVPIFDGRDQVDGDPDDDSIEALAWFDPDHLKDNPAVRDELAEDLKPVLRAIEKTLAPMLTKAAHVVALKVDEGAAGDYRARHLIGWYNEGGEGRWVWGAPGDLTACHAEAVQHMSSGEAWRFCNTRHHDVLGTWNSPKD